MLYSVFFDTFEFCIRLHMKENTLTLEEANNICREYQHLVGRMFCGEYREFGTIEAVVVAPSGKLDKWAFAKYYQRYQQATQAISFYTGDTYDVVLIGRDKDKNVVCRDLSAHLSFITTNPDLFVELD